MTPEAAFNLQVGDKLHCVGGTRPDRTVAVKEVLRRVRRPWWLSALVEVPGRVDYLVCNTDTGRESKVSIFSLVDQRWSCISKAPESAGGSS